TAGRSTTWPWRCAGKLIDTAGSRDTCTRWRGTSRLWARARRRCSTIRTAHRIHRAAATAHTCPEPPSSIELAGAHTTHSRPRLSFPPALSSRFLWRRNERRSDHSPGGSAIEFRAPPERARTLDGSRRACHLVAFLHRDRSGARV